MHKLPYAEDVNYWMTGKSSPDAWTERSKKEIEKVGGRVTGEAYGSDGEGRSAFMLSFTLEGEAFKIVWPVLPTRRGNDRAARVQAATMMYHDIKARCMSALVLGKRAAFFTFLLLSDGRTANDVATPDLAYYLPELFGPARPQLTSGDVIEGEMAF